MSARPTAAVAAERSAGGMRARAGRGGHYERTLFERVRRGDAQARGELAERFMPLARAVVNRYANRAEPYEDLLQVASIGLLNAIDRFEPHQGHAFTSYAVPTIVGELKRHFRDRSWNVRPPRALLERALRVDTAVERLSSRLGRAPTAAEIGRELDLPEEHVLGALQAHSARRGLSLDAPVDATPGAATLADLTPDERDGLDGAEARVLVDQLSRLVSERDREILRMRFAEDMTQAEIGDCLGVSQMQISRLIRAALQRLRSVVGDDALAA